MLSAAPYGSLCPLRRLALTCPSTWSVSASRLLQRALRNPGMSRVQREIITKSGALFGASGLAHVQDMDGEENANTSHKEKKSRRHNIYVGRNYYYFDCFVYRCAARSSEVSEAEDSCYH